MTRPPRQPDILLCAHIALNLAPNLSGNARRVGGAILAHWNRRTSQCDPSVERLARMLDVNRATVLRATAELCDGVHGLFDKASHGGKGNRASYAPRWDRLRAIVEEWNGRMMTGEAPAEKVAKLRRTRSQNCDVDGRKTATQTYRRNLLKEPSAVDTPQPAPKPKRKGREVPGQGWLLLPLPGRQTSHAQAAHTAAEMRVERDVREKHAALYPLVVDIVTPDMMARATAAEMQRPGTGAPVLISEVASERRKAG